MTRLGGIFYMEGCLTFDRKLGHVELIYKYSVCICRDIYPIYPSVAAEFLDP